LFRGTRIGQGTTSSANSFSNDRRRYSRADRAQIGDRGIQCVVGKPIGGNTVRQFACGGQEQTIVDLLHLG
jgi:hypothetical protein